jgi:hypothetical protein
VRKGEIREKITADYILELYSKASKLKSQDKKKELFKKIKVLSKHLGYYIIKPLDSE